MATADWQAFIDVFAKISFKTGVTFTDVIPGVIFANGILWANVLIVTFVNISTTGDFLHQVEVIDYNSVVSLATTTKIASDRVRAV